MQKPSISEIAEWKITYEKYRPYLSPNRKTPEDALEYLRDRYTLQEHDSPKVRAMIGLVLLQNKYYAQKMPEGAEPLGRLFEIVNEGAGAKLYRRRDPAYAGAPIYVSVEEQSGYVSVEGCDELSDELTAFLGLDAYDIDNFYLVANYIRSLRRLDLPLPGEGAV